MEWFLIGILTCWNIYNSIKIYNIEHHLSKNDDYEKIIF